MAIARTYKRGLEFPHEGFVQGAIETHFLSEGFVLDTGSRIDLLCTHPDTGESWHIEAKGFTSQIGLDFRTCLGQLLQGMTEGTHRYAIAIPDIAAYQAQVARVSPSVVSRLGIHWIFVSQQGSVRVVPPACASPTERS